MLGPMQGREYSLYCLYLWSLQGYAFFTLWTIQFVVDRLSMRGLLIAGPIDYVAVFDTINFI